jgi:hypothetical protein
MRASLVAVAVSSVLAVGGCGSDSSQSPAPPQSPTPDPNLTPTVAVPEPQPPPQPAPQPQPQPDRFVDVERLDANAECDALVPSASRARSRRRSTGPPPAAGCPGHALTDGTGHVAAVIAFGRFQAQYQVFGNDGRAEQRFTLSSDAFPLPEGWQGRACR